MATPKKKEETKPVDDVEETEDDDTEDDTDTDGMLDKLADRIADKLIAKSTPPKRTQPKKNGVLNFLDSLAER